MADTETKIRVDDQHEKDVEEENDLFEDVSETTPRPSSPAEEVDPVKNADEAAPTTAPATNGTDNDDDSPTATSPEKEKAATTQPSEKHDTSGKVDSSEAPAINEKPASADKIEESVVLETEKIEKREEPAVKEQETTKEEVKEPELNGKRESVIEQVQPEAVESASSRNSTISNPPALEQLDKAVRNSVIAAESNPRNSTISNPPVLQPSSLPQSPERSISPSKPASPTSPGKMMRGLSGDFVVTSPPPPSSADRAQALEQRQIGERLTSPPPPPSSAGGLTRKASSGFGAFLGRMGTIRRATRSPSATRRNTAASLTSVDSNGIAATTEANEGETVVLAKPSLQDQFTNLRKMSEYQTVEINQDALEEEQEENGPQSPPLASAKRHSTSSSKDATDKRSSNPSILMSPPLNPSLPPGTASGMAAGPAEEPKVVNWDLWQQLVYEGPTAVSRTSGKELNEAIQSGIPPAIRGVVWQVLAEAKTDGLDLIYRKLKAKGTDAERPPLPSRSASTISMVGTTSDKDASKSDRSSVHSDNSTATYSRPASPPTSVDSVAHELQARLESDKRKHEAAALVKLEKTIRRDLGARTSFSKYTQSAGLQDGLFGVCKAYALYDESVGYAQGMNFIAMPLLFNLSEEESFIVLVRLMNKYDVRSMFTPDMAGLHLRLHLFERLLEDYEPALSCHLRRKHVSPQLYATPWFLTLFAYRFPLQLVLRVYDLIFSEGLTAILKFGIVLMQHNRDALLSMKDMSQLTTFLKEKLFDVYIDQSPSASSLLDSGFFGSVSGGADKELYRADEMVRDACKIQISDETLATYTAEWGESQRTEREKEQELESLRTGNIALTSQVKMLEERVQQHDADHVRIAQDLVHIKVENDSLQDSNEALRHQVMELQKLLDLQPAEIEARLKEEMDRIMQRNIEVQNENRSLKEEMDEMEHALVNAKMAQAQTQSDHDTLKQRWASVQAMLSDKVHA